MTTSFKSDIDNLADYEFDKTCDACGHTAEWQIWASHNARCCSGTNFACTAHKEQVEQAWIDALATPSWCRCGRFYKGQLSDHFRAIRL